MRHKLPREIKLKNGSTIPVGAVVDVLPDQKHPDRICKVAYDGTVYRLRYTSVFKQPNMHTIESAVCDGVCESILGQTVEPDGYDDHGFPSWLLALGVI